MNMWKACYDVSNMSKMVQVRNVPDEIHRTLKSRAALAGMSLSDYLLVELERIVSRPTRRELLERLRSREPVEPVTSVADLIASERTSR